MAAQTLDRKKEFDELKAVAVEGGARLSELGRIGFLRSQRSHALPRP